MTRVYPSASTLLLLLLGALFAFNSLGRIRESHVTLAVANESGDARVVLVTDGSSGRRLGAYRLEPWSTSLVVDRELDVARSDLSIPERAAGRFAGTEVELLARSGCFVTATVQVDAEERLLSVNASLGISWTSDEEAELPSRTRPATPTEDPCAGRPAVPVGVIGNQTRFPILVGQRVVLDACTAITVVPGDIARMAPTGSSPAVPIRTTSLDIQGARWPLEPRSIVVTPEDVFDDEGAEVDPTTFDDCVREP